MTWVKATGEHELTFHGADDSTLIVQLADPIKHRTDSASIAARDLTKAVTYLRVSGIGQVSGDGFIRQREACLNRAKAIAAEIVDEYRDEGISGTSELSNRPGLAALLDRVESNGVKLVIVERADRIARDLVVGEIIIEQFRKAGVTVIESENGTDLTSDKSNATATMIRQILGVIAQFEKTVIVEKLRAARQRKRDSGQRCEGVKPYGHFPGEEAGLKLIRELAGTMSTRAIAAELNNKQFPSRHGRTWCHSVVAKILKGSNQCAGSNQQNTIA